MQVTPVAAEEIGTVYNEKYLKTEEGGIRDGLRYLARATQIASRSGTLDIGLGIASYISGPYNKTIKEGKIPGDRETKRETLVIMNILVRLEELRDRIDSSDRNRLIDYAGAAQGEKRALKQKLRGL